MAITLYQKKGYQGDQLVIDRDYSDLHSVSFNNKASSIRLTSGDDRVLLYKKKNFEGGVFFIRGEKNIPQLSSAKYDGKLLFGDAVSSVRVTPFFVDVFVNIVEDEDGNLPGGLASRAAAQLYVDAMIAEANAIWDQGLLHFRLSEPCRFRTSDTYFDIKWSDKVRLSLKPWGKSRNIDIHFVNTINGAMAYSKSPGFGDAIVIKHHDTTVHAGNTLAHEMGHIFGIHHASAKKDEDNVMHASDPNPLELYDHQVQAVHKVLQGNLFRQRYRLSM